MAEQNLNAQQMAAVNERFTQHVAKVIDGLNLRKWAMEQALAKANPNVEIVDPIKFAESVYDFVVKPALEPIKSD